MALSQIQSIFEELEMIRQDLACLQTREDPMMKQAVRDGRRAVTKKLEAALGDTLAHRINADALTDTEWLGTACRILEQLADPFQPKNAFDRQFMRFMEYFWQSSEAALVQGMKNVLFQWGKHPELKEIQIFFVKYFERFPLWGTLYPERNDYDTFERRAAVLKRHSYDFLWLYRRLNDYLSKRTLTALLCNWATLSLEDPLKVKSIFPNYWEPDLFPDNSEDILVDVGAYTGDSIMKYAEVYGSSYKKIYAYEVSPDSCETMRANIRKNGLHDVTIRNKGAGSQCGEMFLSRSVINASTNQLSADAGAGRRIKVVTLDEDIPEPVTFLKMDIEGAEWDTLLGCKRIISQDHPKLAICVYHGYDDLWRIPGLIESMYPDYEMYLRHYGGNRPPTEFVLLCRPKEKRAALPEEPYAGGLPS